MPGGRLFDEPDADFVGGPEDSENCAFPLCIVHWAGVGLDVDKRLFKPAARASNGSALSRENVGHDAAVPWWRLWRSWPGGVAALWRRSLRFRTILVTIGVATLCAFAWLAVAAWRGRCRLGVAGSVTALGQGWLNPWYAGWGVSLSATEEDRLAWVLAVGLTAFLLLDVVPR